MSDSPTSMAAEPVTDAGAAAEGHDDDDGGGSGLRPGDEVGRYVLLRPLASGGMGMVYLAFDPELDRNVALKLLLPRARDRDRDRDALIGEARSLAQLSHRNVVGVYDVGVFGQQVYVALEYVAGQSFEQWQRARARDWVEILDVLLAAAEGLAAAHAAGIIHLDVKPSNILVGEDGVVRVLDFGLARRFAGEASESGSAAASSTELTVGAAVGTVGYIAPELLLGHAPDRRSDQFGFCVTAWEALCGARPFAGRTRREYEAAVLQRKFAAPVSRPPKRIVRVLERGLQLAPGDRFEDMHRLVDALRRARQGWLRRPAGLATVAVSLAALGVGARLARAPRQSCDDGAATAAQFWHEGRRSAAAEAFAASELPFAAAAWSSSAVLLDGHAHAWAQAHDELCLQTFVARVRPEPSYQRASACLQERRDEFDATVALFEHADAELVEHAREAAAALAPPARCIDEAPAPTSAADEEAREQASALAARLAQARAWQHAERFEAAADAARRIAADADALQQPLQAARARLVEGQSRVSMGALVPAIDALQRSLRDADVAGADGERLEALIDLVYAEGHLGGEVRRAHWYASIAGEIAQRVDADVQRRLELLLGIAVVYGDEGRHEDALAAFRRALALRAEFALPLDEQLSVLCNNLGSVHMVRGELGVAAAWFAQAFLIRMALSGPDHPAIADPLINQGAVLGLLGESDAAIAHHRRALAVLERARGPQDPSLRVVLNNLAVALRDAGLRDEALVAAERAHALWLQLDADNPAVGVTLCNIAELHLDAGQARKALAEYERALALLRRGLPEGHAYVGAAWTGVGRSRAALGEVDGAIAALRHSLDVLDRAEVGLELRAEPRFALAKALRTRGGEPGLARALALQARREYAQLGRRGAAPITAIDRWLRDAP
ncbi:MAG: serine/threonine-protein kinase [Nannocystaceae bacterium]|nr:serine/threonine-protein kinase [Nannocystaceae bacterium]